MSWSPDLSITDKLAIIAQNPFVLLTDQSVPSEIAGLTDVQKIALAEKVAEFLTENAQEIFVHLGQTAASLQQLKEKCASLGFSAEITEKVMSSMVKTLTSLSLSSPAPALSPAASQTLPVDPLDQANHGKISPGQAAMKLHNKAPGTFLIRDSEVHSGVKIVNYNSSEGKLKEYRLTSVGNGYKDIEGNVYESLEKFLQEKQADLKIICPKDQPAPKSMVASGGFDLNNYMKLSSHTQPLHAKAALLKGRDAGTYLIRESDLSKGVKIINYVEGNGTISEYRLTPHADGYDYKGTVYPTVEKFIEKNSSTLKSLFHDSGASKHASHADIPSKIVFKAPTLLLDSAHAQLTGKQPGTFIVRDSEMNKGIKVIDYVDEKGKIKEFRLNPSEGGYKVSINKESQNFYPSIEAFLIAKKELLKNQIEFKVPSQVILEKTLHL